MTSQSGFASLRGAVALALLAPVSVVAVPGAAMAQAGDPAAQTVEALNAGLIATMKAQGGQAARARVIGPVVDRAFDIPAMARLSVGPPWTTFSPLEQANVIAAFRAMTVAQYAANFDSYSGEKLSLVGGVETRGTDKLVRTQLTGPGTNESLNYRLRENGGQWRIIDVFYRNAISQIATRRSDFAGVIAKGGPGALVAHLNRLAANPK
ncbi:MULTISPECIES: ABC transporter substrate-binding protein [unclassified Novosphingobium]|uniref:ABC transporter substrate-binding protein n=1 Tax=unclassified Novosphingobium TaxID=2644732 RepID=UPI00086E8175|nr:MULTISPECIES: ABC transporter substrate-binding protein [unclassified Novosphingobium]MBN9142999.1 ABC transporter substrate-binding protein [Novosphingobium sp.]MDR6706084.1 phospholipid transport system substrate-binding protein [Novosphingobium sp. 1748]NKJ02539.1 phospholipid transport system substrate-binding protein [Novosphingobium sp. SG707]ODU84862.1 MAG: hopanoid biosynthesis protein HpnM [Novosphingobium sp. SCN 63-17]OJX89358.1 MAG: hopanoid biosynthesis protein HpnM [Novosphing